MAANYLHPSYVGRTEQMQPHAVPDPPGSRDMRRVSLRALRTADRACCCLAKPAVMALMPAAPHRPQETDLLLCAHHYRAARAGLAAAGATVVDEAGYLLSASDAWPVTRGC